MEIDDVEGVIFFSEFEVGNFFSLLNKGGGTELVKVEMGLSWFWRE